MNMVSRMNSALAPGARTATTEHPDFTLAISPTNSRKKSVLIILFFWLAIYFASIFTPPLLDDADSVHAEAAREMVLRHDWVTLHANGIRYLEKAPLMYWSVALSYKIFGVSDWSTRLPLMLGVLAMLVATYELGTFAFGGNGGLYSALALGTSIGPFLFTRFLIPEVLVALWLALGFLLFLKSLEEERPSRWVCWGFAITCALNVLTKGLIGLVFPLGVVGLYLLLTGNLRHLLKLRIVSSTFVFLTVAAPWHVLAALRTPTQGNVRGFLWFYFVNEHFLRYLNKRVPRDYDTVPLLVFWGLLVLWLVPWSAFLPQAIKDAPTRWKEFRSSLSRRQRASLVFLLWALIIVAFFSFSTRQEYYTIPGLPGMALLVGGWLQRENLSSPDSKERRAGRISSTVLFAVGLLVSAIGAAFLAIAKAPAPGVDLADLLRKNPGDYALSFGHFLDLTPQAMGAFRLPLFGFSFAFLGGTALNWYFRRRNRAAAGNLALALMMVVVLTCVHSAFVTFSPILSSKNLADAIHRSYVTGDVIVVDGEYENASTLNFYTELPIRVLHPPTGNLWYGSKFPDAPRVFETPESFATLWKSPQRIFLWTDQEKPKELEGYEYFVLAENGGKAILTNRR
jgi:4-amino-4-deoxy-L-arabinose transferase-like glycosyltransferase